MRKKKKRFWSPIVLGFALLYFVSMDLATILMALKSADGFKENASLRLSSIQSQIENNLEDADDKMDGVYYSYIASQIGSAETSGQFQQFSLAFYRTDGTLLAQTEDRIMIPGSFFDTYTLEDLTDGDRATLARYAEQSRDSGSLSGNPPKYRICAAVSKDSKDLCQILVQELSWKQTDQKGSEDHTDPVTGSVQIQTDAKSCTITNTGTPLTEEQLLHAFDMFYSGDKSRGAKDKHMGLGAFLAKKILRLHGLDLSIKNTQEGIQVSITR